MFDNIYAHGFLRVAVCVPRAHVADPRDNAAETLQMRVRFARILQAARTGAG